MSIDSGNGDFNESAMWSFFIKELSDHELQDLHREMQEEILQRAIQSGDHESIIKQAFEVAFDRSGLGVNPWIEGKLLICPGALVSKSAANHRCRFVSVDQEWVWQSKQLITETKNPSPGNDKGFRAIALIPVIEGTAVDIVNGKMQSGLHRAEKVVSFEIRRGEMVEVSQRVISIDGIHG